MYFFFERFCLMYFMFDDCRHKDPMNEMMRYANDTISVNMFIILLKYSSCKAVHGQ